MIGWRLFAVVEFIDWRGYREEFRHPAAGGPGVVSDREGSDLAADYDFSLIDNRPCRDLLSLLELPPTVVPLEVPYGARLGSCEL